jgi:COP9 signalosome complex subunit 4
MENLTRTIDEAVKSKDYSALSAVFTGTGSNSWQSVGQGEQRSLAAHFICAAVNDTDNFLPAAFESDDMEAVFITALGHLPATVEGAADNALRQKLFECKIAPTSAAVAADYTGAARILAGMRMEDDASSVYYMAPAARCDVYVKIAECFLAEDEIAESDAAVNKAGTVVEQIPDKDQHKQLILRYKSTYARVLDANRKFLQAAQRYHELSQTETDLIADDDLLQLLGRACTCAILAPSGPQRQRVLAHIANDERLGQLDAVAEFQTHAVILKKMHTLTVLRPEELVQFEASLAPHQKAVMGDGLTIMERGIVEHNMLAVSHLYQSIYVSELAQILGVQPNKAEKIAAGMIMEGALSGSIDQVEGLLEFDSTVTAEEEWDRAIGSFCTELNRVTDAIKATTA